MSARANSVSTILALALLGMAARPALAEGPQITQQTKAGTIRVIKDDTSAEFKLGDRLLYHYTQGYCAGIQWHGFAGADELTLVYASTCGNGEGVYPTWRLIVVKADRTVAITQPFGDVPDMQISQLGGRVTFSFKKTIAGTYQQGQLTSAGKPIALSVTPAIE